MNRALTLRHWIFLFCLTANASVTYTYDAAGRLTKVDYGNGSVVTYTYDKAGNLTSRSVVSGGGGGGGNCTYAVSHGGQAFAAAGGTAAVNITTGANCAWSATGAPSWVTFSTSSGNGNGAANYTVAANGGAARSASISIGGLSFTIEQAGGSTSGLAGVGSLAQVASQGTWKFELTAVNLGAPGALARFSFLDNNGAALPLPMTFPQLAPASGPLIASILDRTLGANAQVVIESTGPDSASQLIGWGKLAATGNVGAFGIFSNPTLGWNAVVPPELRNAGRYILAFDNTGALATGVAVANIATTAANIPVIIRDETGASIFTGTLSLAAQGHTSFMLNQQYLTTAGKRGTIELQTPQGGQITMLGLRASGPALTTLPVLAAGDTPGGAIAHATYNGGFTSIFYLVNTGTASASFTLSFFDESGNPLSVPLLLPQSGTTTTTSILTQSLDAGAMLVVETQGSDAAASVVGSAQLAATGNLSGFEIFRWTTFGQEASVPLETRTPASFVLVFDDTNGLTTGVALSNVSNAAANVTARIYDDAGALLQTVAINLAGRGHTSFLLPSNYPVTANKRGMVEFVVPPGGKINAVGLRAKADGTLTTIPVLTK